MGITPYVSKPPSSGAEAEGPFCKLDFAHVAEDDIYHCPAGDKLTQRFTAMKDATSKNTKIKYKLLHCRLLADLARLALLHLDGFLEAKCERLREPRRAEIRFRRAAKRAHLCGTALPKAGENLDLA
jgi:hypothetical protein